MNVASKAKVVFVIQAHQKHDNLKALIHYLLQWGHVIVSIDGFTLESIGDCIIVESPPVCWGGKSQVVRYYDLVKIALKNFETWDYYINLSGDDIVLKDGGFIIDELTELMNRKVDALIQFYGKAIHSNTVYTANGMSVLREYYQLENSFKNFHLRGIPVEISGGAAALYNRADYQPVRHYSARAFYFCHDRALEEGVKAFNLRLPTDAEMRFRVEHIHKFGWAGGRSWYVFSRRFAELFVDSRDVKHLIDTFADTLCYDECFIHMWLKMQPEESLRVIYDNKRFKGGRPENLDDDLLPELLLSKAWFARKLSKKNNVKLLDYLATQYGL